MPVQWFFRFVDRTHILVLPALILLLGGGGYALLLANTENSFVQQDLSYPHLVGTLALFLLLPAYLLVMVSLQQRRTKRTLHELAAVARPEDVAAVRTRMERAPAYSWAFLALGFSIGLALNPLFLSQMHAAGRWPLLDITFIFGSSMTWVTIAALLCWRIPTSIALSRLGERLDLDLYRLDKAKSLGHVANSDVLTAVGAMAFMPLQSLDAEFRLGNYAIGFAVGVGAAILLFIVPIWGFHKQVVRTKAARLVELYAKIERIDRSDIAALETITSHIDRVRGFSTWPVDIQLLTRLLGYVIIPPVAWVAAAIVENFVDRW